MQTIAWLVLESSADKADPQSGKGFRAKYNIFFDEAINSGHKSLWEGMQEVKYIFSILDG